MHLSREELEARLTVDLETGVIVWLDSPRPGWNGKQAGSRDDKGYLRTKIDGKSYRNHQIVWFLARGKWAECIDHRNRNKLDNRLNNLRSVTPLENGRNQSMWKGNTSGVTGVQLHKASGRWRAYIYVKKRQISCGYYSEKDDAIEARQQALIDHGFDPGHGKKPAA